MDEQVSSAVSIIIDAIIVAIIIGTAVALAFIGLQFRDSSGDTLDSYVTYSNISDDLSIIISNPHNTFPVASIYKAVLDQDEMIVTVSGNLDGNPVNSLDDLEDKFHLQAKASATYTGTNMLLTVTD